MAVEWELWGDKTPEEGKKFIALYSDGSGATLGVVTKLIKTSYGIIDWDKSIIVNTDNKEVYIGFFEESVLYWAYLPDNFNLWFENED